jgi:multidrug resistance efflux pump
MDYGPRAAGGYDQNRLGGSATDQISKTTNVHELLNAQAKALTEAHATVDSLSERLRSVLAPLPAPSPSGNATPTPQSAQVSTRISDHTSGLHALIMRLNMLIQQLEV